MSNDKTGIAIFGVPGNISPNSFPKEFKKGIFSRFEPRFTLILLCCFVVVFSIIGILSLRKPSEVVTDKEIEKIQERYARLVLNQPKPEVVIPKETQQKVDKKDVTEQKVEEKKETETVNVDREKETFIEKQQRKEASSEQRRQKREQIAQQVQSSGIFAAITASGSSGGLISSASDLLGTAAESVSDVGEIKVTKGVFATKQVSSEDLKKRQGTSSEDISIQKQEFGRKEIVQVASTASVNISSVPPEITGESSNLADRSQSVIQKIVNRETQRLKRVFEDWLKRDPSLKGNLTIKFVILPSGAVSSVTIVKSTTQNSEFDETIIRYIKRWQFPVVADGSPVEVVYPFVFEGQS
ncbi:MAG TPA: TonB family protein [Chitinispirillaceae bacterium]|nr:TonB family protein [Chitinispirillaceae bacterium]